MQWDGHEWRYLDGVAVTGHPRPCPQCGRMPTPEGHDACLGTIPGAAGACCGHGMHVGYVNWPAISAPAAWERGAYIGEVKDASD